MFKSIKRISNVISLRVSLYRKPLIRPKALIVNDSQIVPEYLSAFSQYICSSLPDCLHSSIIIPPPTKQLEIVTELRHLQEVLPIIKGYESMILLLLNNHDKDTLVNLINAIIELNHAESSIREIADGLLTGSDNSVLL